MTATNEQKVKQRERLLGRNKKILERADSEDRDVSVTELDEWEANAARIDSLNAELDKGVGRKTNAQEGLTPQPRGGNGAFQHTDAGGEEWLADQSGKPVRVFAPDEKLSDHYGKAGCDNLVGRLCVAMARKDNRLLPEDVYRAVLGTSDQSGNFGLVMQMASEIVDAIRSQSVAVRAGAKTIIMESNELKICTIDSDPVGEWLAAGVTSSSAEGTVGATILRARTLRCSLPVTQEILMDAPNVIGAIQKSIAGALGLALDRAILFGASSGDGEEPAGLRTISGVNETASVGTPTSFVPFATAVETCLTNDARPPFAIVSHPRTAGTLDRLVTGISSDLSPLEPPQSYKDLNKFQTTSISTTEGSGSDESFCLIGPFDQILIGMRLGFQLEFARESGDIGKWQRRILGVLRADTAVLHPELFVRLTGVTNT